VRGDKKVFENGHYLYENVRKSS